MREITKLFYEWQHKADSSLQDELSVLENNSSLREDAFYTDLKFGTGGLRGVIGAGTNRMNIHTVGLATQGLANYLVRRVTKDDLRVAISYDSRHNSLLFAKTAASILAASNIKVYLYKNLMPTPCLSFAVRTLKCAEGIMITASHNPAKYNGYKVYGADGGQITTEDARSITEEIKKLDMFEDVKHCDFEKAMQTGLISYIEDEVIDAYIKAVRSQSLLHDRTVDKNVAIVYTTLNGTGLIPVTRTLAEEGYLNVFVVPEQKEPDGNFPTCPYPNPEIREALSLGISYCKQRQADLLIATDPDCDRVGIAVRNPDYKKDDKDSGDEYLLLSGNEVGLLLLEYVATMRLANHTMPSHPVFVKTIVTTSLAEKIADFYKIKTINVLTGFKFIGEQIGLLEKDGRSSDYILGFEESYGYLSGDYVRDKDAVNGVLMIVEMFSYYRKQGLSLIDKLKELYSRFGYCKNALFSYDFEGPQGFDRMQEIMASFRTLKDRFSDFKIKKVCDYVDGLDNLPPSDVLKFDFEEQIAMVVRPSGTEPKLKFYVSITSENEEKANVLLTRLKTTLEGFLKI